MGLTSCCSARGLEGGEEVALFDEAIDQRREHDDRNRHKQPGHAPDIHLVAALWRLLGACVVLRAHTVACSVCRHGDI